MATAWRMDWRKVGLEAGSPSEEAVAIAQVAWAWVEAVEVERRNRIKSK